MSENLRFNHKPGNGKIVAVYPYQDVEGRELYEKARYEPKSFAFRHKKNGEYFSGQGSAPPVPYRLPKWLSSPSVIIAEGEKDADALADLGFASTSAPYGAGNWKPELTPYFKDKLVFIAYDIGEEKSAELVAASLWGTAKEIKICQLPSEKYEFDISNFLTWYQDRPQKITAMKKLLKDARLYQPPDIQFAEAQIRPTKLNNKSLNGNKSCPEIDHPFLNLWVNSISQVTDAPQVFILFSGLGLLSGLLNSHWFSYPRRTQLNLYLLLLAPSTTCRKSVVLDMASDYLMEINQDIVFPESFTPEALLSYLSTNCCGLIIWRELIQVGGFAFGSDYNKSLPSLLTDLYDAKPRFKRVIKGEEPFEVNFPSISILAAGIQSWLISMMTGRENDFYGGLWTRFLMISAPEERKPFRLPKRFSPHPDILRQLQTLHALESKEISLDPILPLLESWGTKHQKEAETIERPEMQASFQRFEVALIKVAALLQLADNPESMAIEPQAFSQAAKIIDYLKLQLPIFFEEHVHFSEFDKAKARILAIIKSKGIAPRSPLLNLSHLKSDFLDKIIRQLKEEARISEVTTPPTEQGGRPGRAYKYER